MRALASGTTTDKIFDSVRRIRQKTDVPLAFMTYINPVFDYYTPVIIANNDYLAENPDQAKAFMEATAKGYEFAAENPDESAQILIDGDNTGSLKDAEDLVKKSQEFLSTKYIDDAESWGVIDADRWNAFYK